MTIDLPNPPSVNHVYTVARGRKILSSEGRLYKQRVETLCRLAKLTPIRTPVVLTVAWRRGRRSGDLSNRLKVVEDAVKGFMFIDDSQVVALHMYRSDDRDNPGVTVTVEAAA